MSNGKGAMRVKNVCIVFRITCDAQTIEELVYLHSHGVLFSLPFDINSFRINPI